MFMFLCVYLRGALDFTGALTIFLHYLNKLIRGQQNQDFLQAWSYKWTFYLFLLFLVILQLCITFTVAATMNRCTTVNTKCMNQLSSFNHFQSVSHLNNPSPMHSRVNNRLFSLFAGGTMSCRWRYLVFNLEASLQYLQKNTEKKKKVACSRFCCHCECFFALSEEDNTILVCYSLFFKVPIRR